MSPAAWQTAHGRQEGEVDRLAAQVEHRPEHRGDGERREQAERKQRRRHPLIRLDAQPVQRARRPERRRVDATDPRTHAIAEPARAGRGTWRRRPSSSAALNTTKASSTSSTGASSRVQDGDQRQRDGAQRGEADRRPSPARTRAPPPSAARRAARRRSTAAMNAGRTASCRARPRRLSGNQGFQRTDAPTPRPGRRRRRNSSVWLTYRRFGGGVRARQVVVQAVPASPASRRRGPSPPPATAAGTRRRPSTSRHAHEHHRQQELHCQVECIRGAQRAGRVDRAAALPQAPRLPGRRAVGYPWRRRKLNSPAAC